MSKIKTYVLTLSKKFPGYHPKKGQPTDFKQKYLSGQKIHTIRGNFPLWESRIKQINQGKAILSVRQWSEVPYKSKQEEIGQQEKLGYQPVKMAIPKFYVNDIPMIVRVGENIWTGANRGKIDDMAKNDGFDNTGDFLNWFPKNFDGIIIHFTDLKY